MLIGLLDTIRDALHGDAERAQIIERDMQNHVAVMKVGGILTTITERDRPSPCARFDSKHFDLRKIKEPDVPLPVAESRALDSRSLAAMFV